ncbi:diguanylate cyclase/phosphodiesterase [Rhizobium freirei PRF 81]|uniref:Diguanylate cyclase/phosphodiesterase n=1 Tax=Rhizobium freirei PRF 81 TaxID=363754 RepID=N6VF83_9HYPH|nr:EAL domain-containing protein [Rhizobium freirei]ENN89767.1 diguanylate cyclase/phosphodiesterase [Rhizobium freirei PRF 81]
MKDVNHSLSRLSRGNPGTILLRALLVLAVLAFPVISPQLDPVIQLNDELVAKRFEWAPRNASGHVAFIAIDKHTLDEVGVWPWPRSVYGKVLDKLYGADVGDIFIDIDFSTPSSASEDALLASALAKVGGGVLLPIFRQQKTASSLQTEISRPIPQLLANAWPVFANVAMDADGLVRRFDFGSDFDGRPTPSAASALSGGSRISGSQLIDFSILPNSIPTYSLADILEGKVGSKQLAGRSVVVGASAAELKDTFSVPVYGGLAGPLIHVLAAETQLQNRNLRQIDQTPLNLLFGGALIFGVFYFRSLSMGKTTLVAAALGCGCEAVAFFLQRDLAIVGGTIIPWALLGLAWVLALNERIDLGEMIAAIAKVDARNSRRLMRTIIADSSDGIIAFDADLRISEISDSAKSILEISTGDSLLTIREGLVTQAITEIVGHYDPQRIGIKSKIVEFLKPLDERLAAYEALITLSPLEAIGRPSAKAFGGCIIIRDITARKLYEDKLKWMSEQDELTGLLNRREFLVRIEGRSGIIALLDIERFTSICTTLGREIGDALLKAVASRLASALPDAPLARIDGDMFAILFAEEEGETKNHAERLLHLFEEPVAFNGTLTAVGIRLGIARCGPASAENSLRAAESALDIAKKSSEQWKAFDPEMALQQARTRRLEVDIRAALRNHQFFLMFQPQIDLATQCFVGAEALLRWEHPELGLISPAEFVPIAESSGQICEIGRWVLMQSCAEAARWSHGVISVNVSAIQFERTDLEADVLHALHQSGLAASRLCLELTESAFINDGGGSIAKMVDLRASGITLALDDFGTGYSSMSYLADLPLDKLKIDQSFVRRMIDDPSVHEIVKAIVSIGHGLGMEIVAEGIEGQAEKEALCRLRCETGQGYLFSMPQRSDDMLRQYKLVAPAVIG